jgi:hypothetical protein
MNFEKYIKELSWDEKSKKYAFEMGKILFAFIDYIESENLSAKTKNTHISYALLLGHFDINYSYKDIFNLDDFANSGVHTYEFQYKVSDSKYAIRAYKSTMKKLSNFITFGTYKPFLIDFENKLSMQGISTFK